MSVEEKSSWIYAVVALVVPAVYTAVLFARADGGELTEVAYVGPMLTAIVGAMLANMVIHIVATVVGPREPRLKDERDRYIDRFGNSVGFFVMSVGALVPLGLAMAEADHFWIANALYCCFYVTAVASAVAKIVGYRRGL